MGMDVSSEYLKITSSTYMSTFTVIEEEGGPFLQRVFLLRLVLFQTKS